jgi:drug/metabolite transporter (DMT)-like permease
MTYYSSLVYLVMAFILAPLASVVGEIPDAHPSIAFLLLFNVMWGFIIWREVPTLTTLVGALLTLLSGMYVLYREQKERPRLNRPLMTDIGPE